MVTQTKTFLFLLAILFFACLSSAFLLGGDQPWDSGHNVTGSGGPGGTGPPGGSGGGGGGDPVNIAFGNLAYGEQDLLIPGLGLNFQIVRYYNSQEKYNGPFGHYWHFIPFMSLVTIGRNDWQVIVKRGDGVRLIFTLNLDGTYSASAGWYYILGKTVDGFTLKEKGGVVHRFDLNGRLLSTTDRSGNSMTFTYDTEDRLISIADASSRQLTFSYGTNNKIAAITDFAGRSWNYRYDTHNNLTSVTNPLGQARTYAYDNGHRLLSVTDPIGNSLLLNTYDGNNRVVSQSYRRGTFAFIYNTGYTTVQNRRGFNVTSYYNALGNLTQISDPAGYVMNQTYSEYANLLRIADVDGNRDFTYDGHGNITRFCTPSGATTLFTYEPNYDQITSTTDPMGHTTDYSYDAKGNLIRMTDALGQETLYEYDAQGKLTKATLPGGIETTFTRSAQGLLTAITDKIGADLYTVSFGYDVWGNVITIDRPNGSGVTLGYSLLGQLTQFTNDFFTPPRIYQYAYNAGGFVTKMTENGNDKTFEYDNLLLTRINYPDGTSTRYTYSENDLFTSVTSGLGTTQYFYNSADRITSITHPEGSGLTLTYTNDYLTRVQGSGKDLKLFYNPNRQLTKIEDAVAGKEYCFEYNEDGNRKEMTDASGKTTYAYDALDRLVSMVDPAGNTTTFPIPVPKRTITTLNDIISAYNLNETNRLINLVTPRGSGDVIANYSYEHPDIRIQVKAVQAEKRWRGWVAEERWDNRGMYRVISPLELLK